MELSLTYTATSSTVFDLHQGCFPTDAEAKLVQRLVASDMAMISVTALLNGDVIGHALLSKMHAPFSALGLAPVSVAKAHRRKAVAAQMIKLALREANTQNWQAAFVLGDPAYYQRFGFSAALAAGFNCEFQGPYFMALPIGAPSLPCQTGRVSYAAAFADL